MDQSIIKNLCFSKTVIIKKIYASIAILLVSALLLITVSYAWVTLSLRPEVSNITTAIGANGNLEIALATADHLAALEANNMYESDDTEFVLATGDPVHDNVLWGNLLDLIPIDYGLHVLNMRPVVLNIVDGDIAETPITVGKYGADGRLDSFDYSSDNIDLTTIGFSSIYDVNRAGYYAGSLPVSAENLANGSYDKETLIQALLDQKQYGVRIAGTIDYYSTVSQNLNSENVDLILDGYCFAIDLLFRTNASSGNLMLQTEGVWRFESEYDEAYQGSGSFIELGNEKLTSAMKVVFTDTITGKVYALAQADAEGKLWITARADETGTLVATEVDDASLIKPLVQNQVSAITAWVYLDGNQVDNSAASTEIAEQMKLNLQFSTDTVLNPAYTDNNTNPNYPNRPEMPDPNDKNNGGLHGSLTFTSMGDGTCYVSGIGTCTETDIVIPSVYNGERVTAIGDYAFDGCSGLTSITIPAGVTTIGNSAFHGCSGLTSITIPESVTGIGNFAFHGCSSLTSITIPESILHINICAFSGCSSLTSITIPAGVTSIGDSAFDGCSGLTSITIPDSVTSIGDDVFWRCSSLTSIEIPDSVTAIGSSAFRDCTGLTSIEIPASVTSIGGSIFYGCSGLTSITVAEGNSVYHSDGNCVIKTASKTLVVGYKNGIIPNDVTRIGNGAFSGCSDLTSVTIPASVASIGTNAFFYCTGLTSITIPDNVASIGRDAFNGCSSLSSVTFGENSDLTELGNSVFEGCEALTSIVIPDGVTTIEGDVFRNCIGLTSVTIPAGVTSIGAGAFSCCYNLTSIEIPPSVTSIGNQAFLNCRDLITLTIPASVINIFNGAFGGCSGLTSVTVAEGNSVYHSDGNCVIETTSKALVIGCKTSVIPNSVTEISPYAFSGCSGLTSVEIPDSVTSIGRGAFQSCRGLTSVIIPACVTSIDQNVFYWCTNLTDITFDGTVAQWNAITKGSEWNTDVPATKVVCSDGTVTLS